MLKGSARKTKYELGGKGIQHQTPENGSSAFFVGSRRPPLPPSTYYQRTRAKRLEYAYKYYRLNKAKCIKSTILSRKKNPLIKLLQNMKQRCNYPKDKKFKYYGGKGIKCLLTGKDLKFLWFRDKAFLMKQPSIDRKNNSLNYTLDNCQFLEMELNRIKRC